MTFCPKLLFNTGYFSDLAGAAAVQTSCFSKGKGRAAGLGDEVGNSSAAFVAKPNTLCTYTVVARL